MDGIRPIRLATKGAPMTRYRVYLSDQDDFVQQAVPIDCGNDGVAVDHARTLIDDGGRVELWNDDTVTTPLIGSFRVTSGRLSTALVRRIRGPDGV